MQTRHVDRVRELDRTPPRGVRHGVIEAERGPGEALAVRVADDAVLTDRELELSETVAPWRGSRAAVASLTSIEREIPFARR